MSVSTPEDLLVSAINFLDEAAVKTIGGELVDLARFEADAKIICEKIAAVSKTEAEERGLLQGLEILTNKLFMLEREMVKQRDGVREKLSSLSRQSEAVSAYSKNTGE